MQDSIQTTTRTVWQSENDIVIPVTVEEPAAERSVRKEAVTVKAVRQTRPAVKAHYGVPRLLSYPYVGEESTAVSGADASAAATDSIPTDSIVADSVAAPVPGEVREGIVLINPASKYLREEAKPAAEPLGGGMSWIYLALAALFCIIGIKFKSNARYMKALVSDLTDTRIRHNAFDETVKETSLLVLLNLMWVACAGVLLWQLVYLTVPHSVTSSISVPDGSAEGIGLCMGVAAAYMVVMMLAYWAVGSVFSDRSHTRLWIKGAAASTGLETFLLFPVALLSLTYPEWRLTLLCIAGGVFAVGKIVFLYKGFRIFFTQISSWMLFLYYLCSLEIVPLILTYVAAVAACTLWL